MTFVKRLLALQRQGDLSTADLAIWFERPYSTVRSWVVHERDPRYAVRDAEVSLRLLQHCIKDFEGLRGVSENERPTRIRELRTRAAANSGRLPKASAPARRV
jgi:hypothetical protein